MSRHIWQLTMKRDYQNAPIAYVSFITFISALDHLRAGSLDAALTPDDCGALSEPTWNQLSRSLKLLDLIDDEGVPKKSLKSLVHASNRKRALRSLLEKRYPGVFAADLSRMTPVQLNALLAVHNVAGETLRKARSFFLGAAKYSEVSLSAELLRVIRRRVKRPVRSTFNKIQSKRHGNNAIEQSIPHNETVSLAMRDISLAFSYPAAFAELDKTERESLYHLLDELVLARQRAIQRATATRQDELTDLKILSDSNDEAIH